jgi:hypothetical protein
MKIAWIALILTAVCAGVLDAGCSSTDSCCPTCSHPLGACGDNFPINSAGLDGGAGDPTGTGDQ